MNDKPAAAGTQTFETRDVDLREVPGQSDLFLDFLYSFEEVSRFYPNNSKEAHDLADTVLESYSLDRSALVSALEKQNTVYGADESVFENLRRLEEPDCVAVMTGQQAGLFTGPLYTIFKAVSAILKAEELTASGLKAVPVFWIASEDHDIEEVSGLSAVDADGGIREFAYDAGETDSRPVGFVKFDGSVRELINEFAESLPETSFTGSVTEILYESYREGDSFSDSFGKAIASLFRGRGLILVSPLDPDVRKLAAPFVERAVTKAPAIRDALIRRGSELEAAGYHSQVLVNADFFPFFLIDDASSRVALRLDEDGETLIPQNGAQSFTVEGLLERLKADAGCLSPNALMRPAVQDYLFPNVCYFGGGAEVAYFAQNSSVYETMARPVTPIRHRSSFTVVEPRNRRTLEKYLLEFTDLFRGSEEIYAEVIEKFLDPETARSFNRTEKEISALLSDLQDRLQSSDPTLAESLSKRREKILFHIVTLRKKFTSAELVKDETAARRLRYLFNTMLPNGGLQERTLGVFHFLDLYGERFIDWIFAAADADQEDHRLLFL